MIENWISAFQLGAALSFVLGAYAGHRQPREEQLEKWATEAVEQISELRRRDGGFAQRRVAKDVKLNTVHWREMSTTDLNDYRRDVTVRYYDTIERYKKNDRKRQGLLWMNGLISVIALLTASAVPDFNLPLVAEAALATVLVGIPIACMLTVWREDVTLAREASPSNPKEAEERSRAIHFRSDALPSQTFHVFAEIRRRSREDHKSTAEAAE